MKTRQLAIGNDWPCFHVFEPEVSRKKTTSCVFFALEKYVKTKSILPFSVDITKLFLEQKKEQFLKQNNIFEYNKENRNRNNIDKMIRSLAIVFKTITRKNFDPIFI